MIKLENFSKKYSIKDENFAAKNVSLTANDKCITGILGPNGAGKTTIIKAICSFHYPTSGNIFVTDSNNNKIDCSTCQDLSRNQIGYVPEVTNLPNSLTVAEYLEQIALNHNLLNQKIPELIKKVAKDFSLKEVLQKKIKTLSKGYKQRTAFAGALIYSPQNIILDEPVNGLDPAQIIQFRKLIKDASSKASVLISTHLMQEVEALCDYIYIINDGSIKIEGTKEQIIKNTNSNNIEEAFLKVIGQPDEN